MPLARSRPIDQWPALQNWLIGSSGHRAANVMILVQPKKINNLNPLTYLKDAMERSPTNQTSKINESLPLK